MGKWNALSDYDYFDVPQANGTPCATKDCPNDVSLPEWDTYCSECRQKQQDRAEAMERWMADLERRKLLKRASGTDQRERAVAVTAAERTETNE